MTICGSGDVATWPAPAMTEIPDVAAMRELPSRLGGLTAGNSHLPPGATPSVRRAATRSLTMRSQKSADKPNIDPGLYPARYDQFTFAGG
jgi:hypothetical protein